MKQSTDEPCYCEQILDIAIIIFGSAFIAAVIYNGFKYGWRYLIA